METKRISHKLSYLVVLLLFAVTACSPAAATQSTNVDTQQIVDTVVSQVESQLKGQGEIVSVAQVATPASALSSEVAGLQDALIHLYQQVNPSVVYIVVSSNASGSGFVYSKDGYIVTNNHVVAAGNSYEIVFASGDRMQAKLIGADPDSDLAVLKVDKLPAGVTPLALANEEDTQVGELAVAIGNPFGEQGSMSLGIVSGLGRSLPSQRATNAGSTYSLPQVIQTDAPINPGNSGGPLLNLDGQVIGVNAAIASSTGTNSGVGFSIPVAAVKLVVPSLIQDGKYVYPYMGASFDSEVSLDEQSTYGLPQTQGAYVVSVTPGSPAAQAGLVGANQQTGQGGGQTIQNFADLNSYLVFHTHVGQTIQITVLRGGDRVTLSLTLGARP
jgi:S1-C subfamily serine protease